MVKIEVNSVRLVCDDVKDKEYIYTYYLIKSKLSFDYDKDIDIYGIEVSSEGVGFDYFNINTIKEFTISKEYALKTIKELIDSKVSSIHFIDVLSDKIEENAQYTYENSKCL